MFGIGKQVVESAGDLLKARENSKLKRLELADARHERELNATSKAIERAATANGLKGLWRPILMIVLTFLVTWHAVQTFIMVGTFSWHARFGGGPGLSSDERYLLSEWLTFGASLVLVLGAFGGVTSWSRGKEKIAGKAASPVGAMDAVRDKLDGIRPEPVVERKPMAEAPETIERMDGIVVPSVAKADPAIQPVVQPSIPATQSWKWSERSKRRLSRAHPDMQRLFEWLLPRSPYDLAIVETTRSVEKQRENIKKGVSKTMNSRHLERPAMATDFVIIHPVTGDLEWNNTDMYLEVLNIMKRGADEMGISVTSGGLDWNWDWYHIELHRDVYPRQPSVLDDPEIVLS